MTVFAGRSKSPGIAAQTRAASSSRRAFDVLLSDVSKTENYSKLIRITYGELCSIAARLVRNERRDDALQPVELVHELFIRLAECGPKKYHNPRHFFAIAARSMWRILVESARARRCQKRGGLWHRVPLEATEIPELQQFEAFAIDDALKELERFDKHLCRIVRLRVFENFSVKEIAKVLHIGESTARRDWAKAKNWIREDLEEGNRIPGVANLKTIN